MIDAESLLRFCQQQGQTRSDHMTFDTEMKGIAADRGAYGGLAIHPSDRISRARFAGSLEDPGGASTTFAGHRAEMLWSLYDRDLDALTKIHPSGFFVTAGESKRRIAQANSQTAAPGFGFALEEATISPFLLERAIRAMRTETVFLQIWDAAGSSIVVSEEAGSKTNRVLIARRDKLATT